MKKCCEYCQHYEEDYELHCESCRGENQEVNHSNFELNYELTALKIKAEKMDEKETPLSVIVHEVYEVYLGESHEEYKCSKCVSHVYPNDDYCSNCGQKLKWESEGE